MDAQCIWRPLLKKAVSEKPTNPTQGLVLVLNDEKWRWRRDVTRIRMVVHAAGIIFISPAILFAKSFSDQSGLKQELVDRCNQIAIVLRAGDTAALKALTIDPDKKRDSKDRVVIAEGRINTALPVIVQAQEAHWPIHDVGLLSKALNIARRPSSAVFNVDYESPSIVLNFDCSKDVSPECIKHVYLFFRRDSELRLSSTLTFKNSRQWDDVWNTYYRPVQKPEAVDQVLFAQFGVM